MPSLFLSVPITGQPRFRRAGVVGQLRYLAVLNFRRAIQVARAGGHELEAVRAYEAANRGRKTILSKVAQLQSS
mgnify:CR=1 FL=1